MAVTRREHSRPYDLAGGDVTQILILAVTLVLLAAVFFVVERLWPAVPDMPRKRTGRLTDVTYYFFNATVTKFVTALAIGVTVLAGARFLGQHMTVDELKGLTSRDTWISGLPTVVQFGMLLVIADFLGYWSHRLFHFDPRLWRIHAVHHSSRQVDWLAAVRVHPLNDALTTGVQAVPLLLIGFNFEAFSGYVALLTLYAIFLHSNVPWSYGPLRYVVASPVFHRWHHTTEKEGIDKNFAGLLPVWDLAFRTFYMPEGLQPMEFGIVGEAVPEGFWWQLLYPLRPGMVLVNRAA